MEKPTHYVEARILPLDGNLLSRGDMAFVTSRLMTAVHLAIVDGLKIAVSFPDFQQKLSKDPDTKELTLAGTGSRVRIFGSMNDLMSFIVRQDVASLIGEAALRFGGATPIREVPSMVAWENYRRNRKIERGFAGYKHRANRRLEKYGQESKAVGEDTNSNRSAYAHINVTSASTGQKFSLFLEREDVGSHSPKKLSSYGFGVDVPVF